MKFESQICTSREQSDRLLALGLRKETADMCWFRRSKNADWESSTGTYKEWVEEILPIYGYTIEDIIPAWSLHRLIEVLDTNPCVFYTNCGYDNIIDRIEEYIKEGFIDTRYLEEQCLDEEE